MSMQLGIELVLHVAPAVSTCTITTSLFEKKLLKINVLSSISCWHRFGNGDMSDA